MPKIAVVHLNGCERCAWQLLTVDKSSGIEISTHPLTSVSDDIDGADYVVITGYARKADEERIRNIASRGKKVILYGTCPYSGGIFGLMNQKGADVTPVVDMIDCSVVAGCPPSPDELVALISGKDLERTPLCKECSRTFSDDKIQKIIRLPDWSQTDTCFNNQGLPCNGVVSAKCAQKCIDFNTPCRGCVDLADDPPGRMIGYFGSLASQIDVDTAATAWTTDRLGNRPDELSRSLVDVVGTFLRFHLASHFKYPGRNPSTGDEYADIMVARPIEEAPQIAATIYGRYGISVALNLIEAYEAATGIDVADEAKNLRESLRESQRLLLDALEKVDVEALAEVLAKIREIGGNDVLSNVYFGGFKTPVKSAKVGFDTYKVGQLEIEAVEAGAEDEFSKVRLVTDEQGIIREWSCELRTA
ncbi:MAG: hypothetical protein ACTSVT_12810 [Candidatus Thorarchaeota archaeon]